MGIMNTLNGSYTGKVGSTYGVRQYRKNIEKVVPFSHAPHNITQTNSVRAFEALNRFSSFVSRVFWQFLNLSDKKVLKHNAVSKWFAPVVKNHTFSLENIEEVIPTNPTLYFIDIQADFDHNTVVVQLHNSKFSQYTSDEKIFIAFVTEKGVVKAGGVYPEDTEEITLSWDATNFSNFSIVMFKSSIQFKKKIVNGFCIYGGELPLVIDGVFYTARKQWRVSPLVQDSVFYLSTQDASVSSEMLFINNPLHP